MKRKIIGLVAAVMSLISLVSLNVSAKVYDTNEAVPYDSYTYWNNYSGNGKTAVYSKPIYNLAFSIRYSDIGLENNFKKITDVCTDSSGRIYILDSVLSSVTVLNSEYKFIGSFTGVDKSGEELNFSGASGIFADNSGSVYIADTENTRVIETDINGKYLSEYLLPDSKLIPSDFNYKPIKIVKDSRGYMYVLSDGSYYGAILYSPEREFLGFYGADTVKNTASQVIKNLLNRLLMNNTKRAASASTLPYQFTDLYADKNDFIFTVTGSTGASQKGQIRKLSPGGKNVLNSDGVNFADNYTQKYKQDLLGIAVDENGYIYALDSAYGHIFVYDQNKNLLGAFGCGTREGTQKGSFSMPSAIALNGDDIIVSDSVQNVITVFRATDYGKELKNAQSLTNDGRYLDAKPLWEDLIKQDKQNQLTYIGLAKANYDSENYKAALSYAKTGCDKETYALAFAELRNTFLINNFAVIIICLIAVVAALIVLIRLKKKNGIKLLNDKMRTALSIMKSPGLVTDDIRLKNKGSFVLALIILLLFYISTVMKVTDAGFCFTSFSRDSFNSLLVLLQTVGGVGLFTVCFWGVSTIMAGQGKLKDIFLVLAYSLQPMIIANVLYIVLSNIMLPSEVAFLDLFMTVMTGYTAFILIIALMRLCDYGFGKFVGVSVITVGGMVVVIFVGLVVLLLLQLLFGFGRTIFNEIYKMITIGG